MGHVSTGTVFAARESAEFPGRQHRGTRTRRPALSRADLNRRTASVGEQLAAATAAAWGASVVERNFAIGGGEIDLIVETGRQRIAVEVKTSTVDLYDAAERFDDRKQSQVTALGRLAACGRVDLVTVYLGTEGYVLRWVPDAG